MLRSCESDKIGECKVIGCLGHHSVVQDLNGCPLVDHPWKEWNGRNGGAKLPLMKSLRRYQTLVPAAYRGFHTESSVSGLQVQTFASTNRAADRATRC